MITVTLEKRNGVAIGASENATMGIESKMLARPPQPLTANTTSSKCRLWVKMDKGGPVVEEWLVTETYATVKANLTTDDAEAGAELTANKDASNGYVGLTLLKINFKNVLNTFTSFFTNTNTAARTYTFQDRDGTILDDTDLATRAPNASPRFTGVPEVPTAAVNTNTDQAASTAFVQTQIAAKIIKGTATLVAGTIAVSASTVGAASYAIVQKVSLGGTVAAGGYKVTMSAGVGFTVTALQADGTTTETANTDVISYILAV